MRISAPYMPTWMEEAIWDGNLDLLNEKAPCECCCSDHTFEGCPARLWYGCRGQDTVPKVTIEEWAKHYGMTVDKFLGY